MACASMLLRASISLLNRDEGFFMRCPENPVSCRVLDAPYRSGLTSTWTKCKNPAAIEVQRARGESWNR
jgi:hypothetical protein